ncbi:MAG: WYL domain-containing protein [Deltaproteobacteria bacterium]|nr:WYL domain-containing protein [Deltaproteobacteria bacterium]
MARADQASRLRAVEKALVESGPRGVVLKALGERHGWPLRTLYRDIKALERAGFPVAVMEPGRYRIMGRGAAWAAQGIDAEELAALILVRRLARAWRETKVGRALDRLYSKISAAPGSQQPALPLAPGIELPEGVPIDYGHRPALLMLERATRERRAVACRYLALSTGEVTQRVIEPCELYWDPRLESLYVIAHCRLRKDTRVFAVHRFESVVLTEERFVPRPGVSSKAALRAAFRVWRDNNVESVKVRFTPRRAPEIRERRWHGSQTIAHDPETKGGIIASFEVAGLAEIERWVLGFGAEAEVLAPAELVARVRDQLAAAQERYARPARRRGSGSLP